MEEEEEVVMTEEEHNLVFRGGMRLVILLVLGLFKARGQTASFETAAIIRPTVLLC